MHYSQLSKDIATINCKNVARAHNQRADRSFYQRESLHHLHLLLNLSLSLRLFCCIASLLRCWQARASDVQLLQSLLTQRLQRSTSAAVTGVKRHLRRRTTAYRSFAMPVRAKQNPSKHQLKRRKIPFEMRCRKHRRRPNVLYKMHDLYAEECEEGVRWLDTHIWHAKRMKMVRRWGFVLPKRHAERGLRASTKVKREQSNAAGAFAAAGTHCFFTCAVVAQALKQACVLHDLSYCRVLQLVGPETQLLHLLQSMTVRVSTITYALSDVAAMLTRCLFARCVH
jgi:hypothetical protein